MIDPVDDGPAPQDAHAAPPLAAILNGRARRDEPPAYAAPAPDTDRADWRLLLIAVAFALGFGAVGARMAAVTLSTPAEPRLAATDAERHVARAAIVDRAGRTLARNLPAWSAYAHPHELDDPTAAAEALASVLDGVDAATLAARFGGERRFAWIKRPISPEERQAIHDLGLPGVYFGARDVRVYPAGRMAAHVLGGARAGDEGVRFAEIAGLAGVERFHDEALRDPARDGAPLRLSLDLTAQAALTEVLRDGVERFNAVGAAAVLMHARTGAVAALVSLPDFDPNARPDPNDPYVARVRPMMNRVAEGVFELGSTFKPLVAALAIDRGLVTADTKVDARGPLVWGRHRIRDFHRMPNEMTVAQAMARSSNVVSARLGLMAGTPAVRDYFQRLGFFEPTGLEIAEARLGQPLLPARWADISTITISFGHGLAATPLHLAVGYAAMVNGGFRVRPTLDPDAPDVTLPGPDQAAQVLSAEASKAMRRILRESVTNGTGRSAEAPGYEVGGKTGTADKPRPGGGYFRDRVMSTFAAAFPMSDPEWVLVLTLDEPEDRSGPVPRRTAGWTAAPVTGEAIRRLAPLLGLRPALPPDPEPAPTADALVAARPVATAPATTQAAAQPAATRP
ncbi:MAG: penicillin-binding protein 2 [Rhodobacteraceae bacterium]|nr:MAG: penicillin-binding protein 2 [Paracoccaceae bacterium]